MTWVLFVITILSGGGVQVESAGRFPSAVECRRAASEIPTAATIIVTCERRREVDA